jgi:hypothetical protein
VLFHLASKLFAYYPGRPLGQRIVQVSPNNEPFINTSYVTMFYDSKRKRAVVVGGTAAAGSQNPGVSYYDSSANPMLATRVNAGMSDRPPGGPGQVRATTPSGTGTSSGTEARHSRS